jgi:inorganic pyrophosphatase
MRPDRHAAEKEVRAAIKDALASYDGDPVDVILWGAAHLRPQQEVLQIASVSSQRLKQACDDVAAHVQAALEDRMMAL